MPKIYEYLGFIFLFYSNDHLPIHVHVMYGEFESKIEFEYENGLLIGLKYSKVKGKAAIKSKDRREINLFLNKYHKEVIKKWNDFFVFNKSVKCEVITRKIK